MSGKRNTRDVTARSGSEERLRASAFRALIENVSDIVVVLAADGEILYQSPSAERLNGYEPGEVVGRNAFEYIHPDDLPKAARAFSEILQTPGAMGREEARFQRKDGTWRTLEWVMTNLREQPQVRGIVINARDVTERKEAEGKLQKNEASFRALIENVSDIISVVAADGSIVYESPSIERFFGFKPEELVGRKGFEYVHPEDLPGMLEKFAEVLRTPGASGRTEGRFRDKEGSWRILEGVYRNLVDHPDVRGVVINARDITERRTAEDTLRESEERFRALFEGSLDAIFLADPESGTILDANPAAEDLLRIPLEELQGRPVWRLHPTSMEGLAREMFARFLEDREDGEMHPFEAVDLRCDGAEVPVEVLAHVIQIDGVPVYYMMHRDITDRKRMEQELLRTQKLESLGTLAGGLAHDFNNILTAILANLSLLRLCGGLEGEPLDILADSEKATLRAKGLTQQLLTFAKGGAPIKKTVALQQLIVDAAEFALSGSSVRCEYRIPEPLWPVEADEGQIGQLIHNLTLNADQAMPEGGVITIRAENVAVAESDRLPLAAGRFVRISVIDSGVGIPEIHLQKIFDPFFTTKQKGSGLGLSTSFNIVKNHGGCIRVESAVGRGTTFSVHLPASDRPSPPAETGRTAALRGKGRILVVDDEPLIRRSAGGALRRLGYEVAAAEDGRRAIELYEQALKLNCPFDAVLMDLTIPGGLGGREATRELLRIDPAAKVIASSGYSNDPVMAEFGKHGFKAVIEKPYGLRDLASTLQRVIKM
ncbi:MAG: PAS domain S-box protein [bacterium]